jgi:hypothetical protein
MVKAKSHLVGAYGLFWDRWSVNWKPGAGDTWQMLGRRNVNVPALRVCDFRPSHGVYILYGDYGPTYTGIARGQGGLGARLRTHHTKPPHGIEWSRFSWFTFDDVIRVPGSPGWEMVTERAKPVPADSETVIREMEALLIQVLGTTQNKMRFQRAHKWQQLDHYEAQALKDKKIVDPSLFTAKPYDPGW